MRLLALDPAIVSGFCHGNTADAPRLTTSGSQRLIRPREPIEQVSINAAEWVANIIDSFNPELICVEHWMPPAAQPSQSGVEASLLIHGAIIGIAGRARVPWVSVAVQTWRKHFIGRSSLTTPVPRGSVRTARQKADDRLANKVAVRDRAALLGYMPKGCDDFDRGDACGIYDWSAAKYAHAAAQKLILFDEKVA